MIDFQYEKPNKVGLYQLIVGDDDPEYVAITLDRFSWKLILHGENNDPANPWLDIFCDNVGEELKWRFIT